MYSVRTENNILKELKIESFYYVNDIVKYFSDKYSNSNRRLPHFELIYENMILNREKHLQFYKICQFKEIYMGSVEGYMSRFGDKDQDVIVEVVVQCFLSESIFLIMKQNYEISEVTEILARLTQISGLLEKDDINRIPEVKRDSGKIFISWTPEYLHEGYNRNLIEKYFWNGGDSVDGWIKTSDKIIKIIKKDLQAFKKHLESHPKDSFIPNTPLSKVVRRSKSYFCKWYSESFDKECEEEWKSKIKDDSDFTVIYYYIRIAIFIVLHKECNLNPPFHKCWPKTDSFDAILIQALKLLLKKNSGKSIMKKFVKHVSMGEMTREIMEDKIDKYFLQYGVLKVKMIKSTENLRIPLEEIRFFQLKKIAQITCGIEKDLLYFVNYDERDLNIPIRITEHMTIHFEEMKRLKKEQMITKIGNGSYGEVYQCKEANFDGQFVIKRFFVPEESVREININEEIKYFKLLSNYRGLMRYDRKICVAFSLFEESLDKKIKSYCQKSEENEKKILRVAYEILKELKELHKWEIIHRDIKPENILLDKNGRATLCDYGCSKVICSQTSLQINKSDLPGTLGYIAPELINGKPQSDKTKSDIWSLGIVIIEMMEGKLSSDIKFSHKINLKALQFKSVKLKKILKKCLNTNPDERLSAKELLQLDAFKDIQSATTQ